MKRFSNLIIKILSLGFGLSIGLVLIAKVCFEMSYDRIYRDSDRIFEICTNIIQPGDSQSERAFSNISGAIAPGFKAEVPGVAEATRITGLFDNQHYLDEDGCVVDAEMRLADSCFFNVFPRRTLAGDLNRALSNAWSAVVSRTFAEKLGGIDACMGRIIRNEDFPDLEMQINGVYDDFPQNSRFCGIDLLVSMESYPKRSTENWLGNDRYRGWVLLERNVDHTSLSAAIRKMQETHQQIEEVERLGTKVWYTLSPLADSHTADESTRMELVILSMVAALLLLVSVLNYILIVISSMVKRSREMGVRKCYGAATSDIYAMLTREAVVHLLLSLSLAAVIIFASRSLISNLLDVELQSLVIPQSIAAVCAVVAVIFAISVAVPGHLYTHLPVYAALKNFTDRSRRWKLGLLGVQIFVNVFLLIMMFVIGGQYRLLMNDDPGYSVENLLHFRVNHHDKAAQQRICDVLNSFPEVKGVAASYGLPCWGSNGDNVCDGDCELFNVANNYENTADFYDLLDIPFIEGRKPQNEHECAVDEAFAEKICEFFDWRDGVVGKSVGITGYAGSITISGVYRNILTGNRLWADDRPSVRFCGEIQDSTSVLRHMLVKVTHIDSEILRKVSDAVTEAQNGRQTDILIYAETLHRGYEGQLKMRNTLLTGIVFSMLIAFMGLIGFVRNETLRRSKEMAIRKINGAFMRDILWLFMLSLLRLSAAVSVVACVLAYVAADRWLEQFSMKVHLSPAYFVGGVLPVMAVATAVVLMGCWRIARANPVDSLKNE